ncbi:MAG: phosphodiester glycosidase family protein [Nitrospirae bacterium YQR-1]
MSNFLFKTVLLFHLFFFAYPVNSLQANWIKLDEGIEFSEFETSTESAGDGVKITVLRATPKYYELKLLTSSDAGGGSMTVKEWAYKYNLLAVINAGMYQEDGKTNVGYMKSKGRVINSHIAKAYKTMLTLDPKDRSDKEFQIIDLECNNDNSTFSRYRTLVQNIRMISCKQQNVWSQQAASWSIAALGMDKSGNILFLMSVTPLTVHEFIDIILNLPIRIYNAMYLEGGKQASLYINIGGKEIERSGRGGVYLSNKNTKDSYWPIPNVLGLVKKK